MTVRSAKKAGGTPATAALARLELAYVERRYVHDPTVSDFGQEAATALGVPPERVFKTLLVDDGDTLAVGVIPVTGFLDLKALATVLGVKKVAMADPAVAERSSGYVVGGISPLGQRRSLRTVLDYSAEAFDTILVSGGRRGFDLELAPSDLIAATAAQLADISRHNR